VVFGTRASWSGHAMPAASSAAETGWTVTRGVLMRDENHAAVQNCPNQRTMTRNIGIWELHWLHPLGATIHQYLALVHHGSP
jgi:hypothetical protein